MGRRLTTLRREVGYGVTGMMCLPDVARDWKAAFRLPA
jgi:hypothetical protein